MAVDPICGTTVDEASALSAERDGQALYFCSVLLEPVQEDVMKLVP